MLAVLGTAVVVAHALIVVLHGLAHADLGVQLSTFQMAFASIVIVASPAVGAALLWSRYSRLGFLLLLTSMAGSLVFGLYYHYVAVSPDHVCHLPPGDAQLLFRLTALLLPMSEALGLAVGLWGVRRLAAWGQTP